MEPAQVLFAVALGTVTLIITGFAIYVAGSTMWGDRWYRRRRPDDSISR
jgi:membrane protein implicated in regulation of membrane protease activity